MRERASGGGATFSLIGVPAPVKGSGEALLSLHKIYIPNPQNFHRRLQKPVSEYAEENYDHLEPPTPFFLFKLHKDLLFI